MDKFKVLESLRSRWNLAPIEDRLYLVACGIGELLGIVTALENLAVNPLVEASSLGAVAVYTVFLVLYFTRHFVAKVSACLLTTALLVVMWFFNDGFEGGAQYFIIFAFIVSLVILRGKARIVVLGINSLLIVGLFILEYWVPGITLKYVDRPSRYLDISTSFGLSMAVLLIGLQSVIQIIARARQETERKTEELNEARDRLRTLGFLTAQVGHELNTPNHVIALDANLLETLHKKLREDRVRAREDGLAEGPDEEARLAEAGSLVQDILKASGQINRVLANLQAEVRPQGAPVLLDLGHVVRQTADLYEIRWREDTDRLTIDLPEVPVLVRGVDFRIQQLMVNLVTNSLQALGNRTKAVRVSVVSGPREAFLTVADEGEGMTQEVQARLGTPLFTTRGSKHGSGLGWGLCLEIVREHQGTIEVESQLGRGTTVKVRFPRFLDVYSEPEA